MPISSNCCEINDGQRQDASQNIWKIKNIKKSVTEAYNIGNLQNHPRLN